MRDFSHLRHRHIDLLDAGRLFDKGKCIFAHEVSDTLNRAHHLAQGFYRVLYERRTCSHMQERRLDQIVDLLRRATAALGECADFADDDREICPFSAERGLDSRVELENIRLEGEASDQLTPSLPLMDGLGIDGRAQGPHAIEGFIASLLAKVPDFAFKNVRYLIETPKPVFGEYEVEALVLSTAKIYRQMYAARLVARDGKIALLREALDTVAAAQAFAIDSRQ